MSNNGGRRIRLPLRFFSLTSPSVPSAGACTNLTVNNTMAQADVLLSDIKFDGTGKYLEPKGKNGNNADDRAEALRLAGILDDYNNGMYCPY